MNFFFWNQTSILNSELKYQNFKIMALREKIISFMAQYPENKWSITKVECEFDENFLR